MGADEGSEAAVVGDVEVAVAHDPADLHEFAHVLVLVEEVGLGEVSEGLVGEESGHGVVEDDGVLSAGALGCLEESDGLRGEFSGEVVPVADEVEVGGGGEASEGVLDE